MRRETGEEEEHGQRIVQISQGVDESGISFFNEMIKSHARLVLVQPDRISDFVAPQRPANLLCKGFVVAELSE